MTDFCPKTAEDAMELVPPSILSSVRATSQPIQRNQNVIGGVKGQVEALACKLI